MGEETARTTCALVAADLVKTYGATRALDGADLEVAAGEVHGLVGANGAGKSTLVKILSGAIRPDSGELGIGDWQGSHASPRQAQELGLATIYQEASLVPSLGLIANVMLGRESTRGGFLRRRRDRESSAEVIRRVGLDPTARTVAGELSPAEQQLLEIAKALHREARVIIMDEPTAALGIEDTVRLFEVIKGLRDAGVSVVYISHRLDDVLAISDRITVMRDGRRVTTVEADESDEASLVKAMIGRALERQELRARSRGAAVLELRRVGQGTRLRNISFTLHAGEVVGVTGLVGSGRSRLARVLFGAEPFDQGEMFLEGEPYRPSSPAKAIARGVALVPEDRKRDALLLQQGAGKNIVLAKMISNSLGLLRLKRENQEAGALMRRLQVKPPLPSALPASMSGGNQQKVSIARWLHAEAQVLVLDEPGQGVDIAAKEQIFEVIHELAVQGCALLVISQEIEELQQIADRVFVMRRGEINAELAADEVTEHRVVEAAMGATIEETVKGVRA
ncbi:MAG: transporter related [Solirubrobacterales bacterium]|nr:transporter related [Solirubrobacterales bacterium]